MRAWLAVLVLAPIAGCKPDYSPNTYASSAVQQANKVERGIIIGVRPVDVSAAGTVGAATGAAAGGAVGSTAGGSVTSTLGAVGGALIGGLVGAGTEKAVADTKAWEYIVRKPNGELVSVTQQDPTALPIGQKVLVIAGSQARIVADYTKDPTPEDAAIPPAPPVLPPPPAAPPAVAPPVAETPLPPVATAQPDPISPPVSPTAPKPTVP